MTSKNLMKLFLILIISIQADDTENIFTNIYVNATWGTNSNGEGFSGGGSLLVNVAPYINFLENFVAMYDIKTIVDAGCGDWEFSKYIKWGNVFYTGYDVVKHVVEKNIANYANNNIHFVHGNVVDLDLPSADLLLCKDVLQHLSNNDIFKFIKQFSKFKYCLITNDVHPITLTSNNNDITTGECRYIDLSTKPFHLIGTKILHYRDTMGVIKTVFFIDNSGFLAAEKSD